MACCQEESTRLVLLFDILTMQPNILAGVKFWEQIKYICKILTFISLRCRTWHVSDDAFYLAQLAQEDYVDETIVAIVDNSTPDDSCDSCQ